MTVTIIGRQGHMEDGEHVTDRYTVEVVDEDVHAIGVGPTAEDAEAAARVEIQRFLDEQTVHHDPAVIAARQAYIDTIHAARQRAGDA